MKGVHRLNKENPNLHNLNLPIDNLEMFLIIVIIIANTPG